MSDWPKIARLGLDGLLVSFGPSLSEPANRAALAFRAAFDAQAPDGVEETSTSLVSVYIRFDPFHLPHAMLEPAVAGLIRTQDWFAAPLPGGRRLWRVPTVYGGDHGPQLAEAAEAAGLTPEKAITELSSARTRVQALGFAPGQPYFGELPAHWDIPRMTRINPRVPAGALVCAIRQLIIFANANATGWRQVGLTAMPMYRDGANEPFTLRPGDEAIFESMSPDQFENMARDPLGGAVAEVLT